jgi:hypothetical protein
MSDILLQEELDALLSATNTDYEGCSETTPGITNSELRKMNERLRLSNENKSLSEEVERLREKNRELNRRVSVVEAPVQSKSALQHFWFSAGVKYAEEEYQRIWKLSDGYKETIIRQGKVIDQLRKEQR